MPRLFAHVLVVAAIAAGIWAGAQLFAALTGG